MPHGKRVKIVIGVDGTCSVDAINFTGTACQAATLEIASALGGQIEQQRQKPEARLRERCGHQEREEAR